jgi:hypothetical protein
MPETYAITNTVNNKNNNQWTFLPELDLFKDFGSPEYPEQ